MSSLRFQITADLNQIRSQLRDLRQEFNNLSGQQFNFGASGFSQSNSAAMSLKQTILALAASYLTLTTAVEGVQKLVSAQRQFDKLNASLITAAGSAEEAEKAFEAIQDFARTTPYGLAQSVEAFVKLTNLGLTPSERALRSYGNTAAALGKDLMQFIEAVADASTFEFERLKEFGIKASQEGDKVRLTFQGTTTEIKKDASEIERYLMKIGEVNFAGTMENRAKTLDGAISALGDSWDNLFLTISQSGTGDLIKEMVNEATGAIDSLTNRVDSGEIPAALGGISKAFSLFGTDAKSDIESIKTLFSELASLIGIEGKNISTVLNDLGNDFSDLKYGVQVITTFVAASIDAAKNPGQGQEKLFKEEVERLKAERDARQDVVKAGFEQAKMLQLLDEVETEMAAKQKAGDRLAKYKIPDGKKLPEENKAAKKALDDARRAFENLRLEARTPLEVISQEFEQRVALIRKFAKAGTDEYAKLIAFAKKARDLASQKETDKDVVSIAAASKKFYDLQRNEEQRIKAQFDFERLQIEKNLDYSAERKKSELATIDALEADALDKLNERRLAKERELQAQLLELQGDALGAARIRNEAEFAQLIKELKDAGNNAGIEIAINVKKAKDLEQNVEQIRKEIAETLQRQQNRERALDLASVNASPREIAVIEKSRGDIRQKTAGELSANKANLEQLKGQGATGVDQDIADLDAKLKELENQAPITAQIFKTSLEDMKKAGVTSAIDGLADGFMSLVDGSKSAKDALRDMAKSVIASMAQIAAKTLATVLVLKGLEAITGIPAAALAKFAGINANVKHTGGIAGGAGESRRVNPALFLAAPRYHVGGIAGLRPGEVPAILQAGEEVLTRNDPRHIANGGGGGGNAVRVVNVIDPNLVQDYMSSSSGEQTILNVMQRNAGTIKQILR